MIRAARLTKRFGTFTAISDVSFQVEPGEIVGFLGPNGAGKSTTMRILAGVFPPTSGSAQLAGYDVVRQSLQARQAVGYFPERVSIYLDMTVREYLSYVADMKGLARHQKRSEVERAVDGCAIGNVSHRLIGTLSKGYRQRVGIAQALIGRPQVLILDEPTAGLDPEQVVEIRKLIRDLRSESTVILSTHILPEVEATCDRVIIINRGRILAVDTPRNLNERLRKKSRIEVEARAPADALTARLRSTPGVLTIEPAVAATGGVTTLTVETDPSRDQRAEIAAAIIAAGWDLLELRTVTLSLEEIFLSVVHTPDTSSPSRPH